VLAKLGFNAELPYPDITTKEKAQQFIGLDMKKLNSEKAVFIKEVIPEWLKEAMEREKNYVVEEQ